MEATHRRLRGELKALLYLLDSSPIDLRGYGYDEWAAAYRSNVSPGLKLHLMIEASVAEPVQMALTQARVSDLKHGRQMALEAGATYVFDKGYYDYLWWNRIDEAGAVFVTRLKRNAAMAVQAHRPVDDGEGHVMEDAIIRSTKRYLTTQKTDNPFYGKELRRITVRREDKPTPLILVTNDFNRSASEIAALYKRRWEIELFFKWIKQNLKVKRFLGRSENAVRTHIYTALIAYLLLARYRRIHSPGQTLKLCLSTLRMSLFQRPETEQHLLHQHRKRRARLRALQTELAL